MDSIVTLALLSNLSWANTSNLLAITAADCKSSFLGIEGWYKYLTPKVEGGFCTIDFSERGVGNVWLILAGIIDILLRVGTFVAVGFFIFGAIKMVVSQGSPEGIKSARSTMTNAIIGLILSVVGINVITFIVRGLII